MNTPNAYTSEKQADPIYRGLAAVAKRIPSFRNGKPTHPATLTRWIYKGVRLQDGTVLKLAARRFPGGWAVTDEAVDEFVEALTRDRCGDPSNDAVSVPASRRKAIDRADRELSTLGI